MSVTYAQALQSGVKQLAPHVATPAQDARILLAHAIGIERDRLTLVLPDLVQSEIIATYQGFIAQRLNHQPVSQIIGYREFWGRKFIVTRDVLDPRPETESLIAAALEGPAPDRILDLGTGSGCILLTLLAHWKSSVGVGTDISSAALTVAQKNAQALGLGSATFIHSDWVQNIDGSFDLVVSNPPYITAKEMDTLAPDVAKWEPRGALTPEGDGLAAYRILAQGLGNVLAPNGRAFFEIGYQQGQAVKDIFSAQGFGTVEILKDMNGQDRVIAIYPD